jgi:hypothetical protein
MTRLYECTTCRRWVFDKHVCPPKWECRAAWEDWRDAEWTTMHAYDAETAAEKYAEHYDCEGGEYAIVSGHVGDGIIYVRKPAKDPDSYDVQDVELYAIRAETVPTYYGNKIERRVA